MKYTVLITDATDYEVTVEADNEEQARDYAVLRHRDGESTEVDTTTISTEIFQEDE